MNFNIVMHKTCVLYQNSQKVPTMGGGYSPPPPPPPPPPGGGGTSICMHIGYVARERPPFSALNFHSGAYHFHKLPKNRFRSITIIQSFDGFCRSGDHHFQNFFNFNPFIASHGRRFRRRSKRIKLVPEPCIFTLKTAQARSGARIFKLDPEHRSFTLDRELVTEPLPIFHFAAAHTYQHFG